MRICDLKVRSDTFEIVKNVSYKNNKSIIFQLQVLHFTKTYFVLDDLKKKFSVDNVILETDIQFTFPDLDFIFVWN